MPEPVVSERVPVQELLWVPERVPEQEQRLHCTEQACGSAVCFR